MTRTCIPCLLILIGLNGCIIRMPSPKTSTKSSPFKQMNFQELIHRYMEKASSTSIEGVYTVSGIVIKQGRTLTGAPKEKTTDRKENYARVAILHEKEGGKDYIELSLNKKDQASYSIIGDFKQASSGNLFVYTHYEPKGNNSSFTFTRDETGDMLEGVRVENSGNKQITYKLTYVRLKPGTD
jgi:hypothetical protein